MTGARMSYDGKHMWINSANVPSGTASVHRVSMDGMTDENLSSQFTGHEPPAADPARRDRRVLRLRLERLRRRQGARAQAARCKTIVNSKTALADSPEHVPPEQHPVFARWMTRWCSPICRRSQIAKVTRADGSTVWILNGPTSDDHAATPGRAATTASTSWRVDRLLIFNNNSNNSTFPSGWNGDGSGSIAAEYQLNTSTMTATRAWSYKARGQQLSRPPSWATCSDCRTATRMVAYSTNSRMREVSSSGQVLQEWTFPTTFGYIEKRATLYGPPPK